MTTMTSLWQCYRDDPELFKSVAKITRRTPSNSNTKYVNTSSIKMISNYWNTLARVL